MQTLEVLAESTAGVSVLKLANTLGIGKSIASRMLASLLDQGYVVREPETDRYHLSLKLTAIALRHAHRMGFPAVCQPILRKLSEDTRELVQLSAVEGSHLIVVASAQAKHGLSIRSNLGIRVSLHATASGKAWLAALPKDQAVALALRNRLTALTPKSIASVEDLISELDVVRRKGYALAEGEFLEDVNAIAVSIGKARFGFVVGALAVSAPASRQPRAHLIRLAAMVQAAAMEIETVWPFDVIVLQDLPQAKKGDRERDG
jgi:DNA-binding IclR family transcriptional regulator